MSVCNGRGLKRRLDAVNIPPQTQPSKNKCRFRERLDLLSQDAKEPIQVREPTPAPEDPMDSYFANLEHDLEVRRRDQSHGSVTAPRNGSSPPVPASARSNVAELEATYGGRALELETLTNEKLRQIHSQIKISIDQLEQSDKAWLNKINQGWIWMEIPLTDTQVHLGENRGYRELGAIAEELRTKSKACEKEVSDLWSEWEGLDGQINQICEQLASGTADEARALRAAGEIQKAISGADEEISKLGDTAIEEAEKVKQEINARWVKYQAKIQKTSQYLAKQFMCV